MSTLVLPILWKDSHERGLKGVVVVHKSDLPLEGARVGDLFPIINKKICAGMHTGSGVREVENFLLYGTRVSRDRILDSLIPELGNTPRFVVTTRVRHNRVLLADILISVKTLTNTEISLWCRLNNTVGYVKSRIRDIEHIPTVYQRLIYGGKILEDHLTLSSYGIKNKSQVYLVRMMRGGGLPPQIFADMSDDSVLTEIEFSPNAPDWRMASEGLNIEGRCKNANCVAFQNMIIHPRHFDSFNLMRHDDIKCPMCHSTVKPRTCGFYNCAWKFDGVQAVNGFSIISQWKDACGYKYHRFNADKRYGSVEWASLLIVAKPRDESTLVKLSSTAKSAGLSKSDKCTICWSEFGSTKNAFIVTVECNHSFHCACIDKWSEWCTMNDTLPSCPVCRSDVEATGA